MWKAQRRAIIDLVSDVLPQHHAITTRKWLSSILMNLKSMGFTTMAVFDPRLRPAEEAHTVLNLFEGEIRITEEESISGTKKVLKILRRCNQKYSENELILTKENTSAVIAKGN